MITIFAGIETQFHDESNLVGAANVKKMLSDENLPKIVDKFIEINKKKLFQHDDYKVISITSNLKFNFFRPSNEKKNAK